MDSCLPKMEAMTPIQTNDELMTDTLENNLNLKTNRNSIVKRPMNAFLLWARGERKRVSSDGYGVSQTSLSKLLGETWRFDRISLTIHFFDFLFNYFRNMSVEEKQPFLDMAETLKRQHHIDHPDYKFKPKQRSTNVNKSTFKKTQSFNDSTLISSPPHCTSSFSSNSYSSQSSSLSPPPSLSSQITPHPIQSNVLAMCQAIIPSTENNHDWFYQLTGQPQSVILAPIPPQSQRTQTSPVSSRRAVRIQIINKHDDIPLPPPTLLPMTPPLPSSSSVLVDDSTPTLVDYTNIFHIPTNPNHHQVLAPVLDDQNGLCLKFFFPSFFYFSFALM